jgi:rhodanese-related sulfurtransferase
VSMLDAVPGVPAAGVPDDVFLLDVREPDEWRAGHAPGARHIPLGELSARSAEIPRDTAVYVICRSGARSARAAHALTGAGWQALNVTDGMQGWESAGRQLTTDSGAEPFVA